MSWSWRPDPGRRRMSACETTPPAIPTPGTPQTSQPQARKGAPPGRPVICRRSPASSSFVLAAARLRALQLTADPRGATADQPATRPSRRVTSHNLSQGYPPRRAENQASGQVYSGGIPRLRGATVLSPAAASHKFQYVAGLWRSLCRRLNHPGLEYVVPTGPAVQVGNSRCPRNRDRSGEDFYHAISLSTTR
jgi:hypothetical protein